MLGLKGDFLGFTFNGVHSSDLGITHVSEGDRYKDNLIPEIEDKTVEIPGLDGAYFYGSNFKTRSISLSIAFDEVTEEQIRKMRQVFGYKHTGELIFDELPYKKYLVKIASPPELEYVCFDERKKQPGESREGLRVIDRVEEPAILGEAIVDTAQVLSEDGSAITRETVYPWEYIIDEQTGEPVRERIYKGEGTIEFIAYYPFAKVVAEYADEYTDDNINEWLETSGLKDSSWFNQYNINKYVENDGVINVYNPGDIETGFRLIIPFNNNIIPTFTLTYNDNVLNIMEIQKKEEDLGVQINTTNGLIEGIRWNINLPNINDSLITSGQIYNEYATGEFFKIQPSDQIQRINITIDPGDMEIYYDYLYF